MDTLRFASSHLQPHERIAVFRDVFGRQILKIDVEPNPDTDFEVDMRLRALPGLGFAAGSLSPMQTSLPARLIDNDDLVMVILRSGIATGRQMGREAALVAGQAIVTANDAPASFDAHTSTDVVNLRFARKRLSPQLADVEACILRPIPGSNDALRLLGSYISAVGSDLAGAPTNLQRIAADHIYELAALAIGANGDAIEAASLGGLRAARLDVALRRIRADYADPEISPQAVAAGIGISTRYLHKLLHETGSSFSERVQELRLTRAFALLSAMGGAVPKVTDAAYAAGFNDLSHFNRLFRRKYGLTPTAARGHRGAAPDGSPRVR